jgi:hypothetical protein
MTVDQVYSNLKFIVRKNQLGSLPPSEFQYAFNTAQRNYYDLLVGRIEQYRYGSAVPRIGLSMTDNVVSRLTPFQKTATLTVSSGVATKPADFNKLLAMYTPNDFRVLRIEEDRFAERIKDSIDPVNEANAFYIEAKTNWRIYPTTLNNLTLKYLYVPVDVVWGYTLDGQGRPVYNPLPYNPITQPNGSIQPEWLENDYDEIIARAAKIIGVSLVSPQAINYGQGVIQTGE